MQSHTSQVHYRCRQVSDWSYQDFLPCWSTSIHGKASSRPMERMRRITAKEYAPIHCASAICPYERLGYSFAASGAKEGRDSKDRSFEERTSCTSYPKILERISGKKAYGRASHVCSSFTSSCSWIFGSQVIWPLPWKQRCSPDTGSSPRMVSNQFKFFTCWELNINSSIPGLLGSDTMPSEATLSKSRLAFVDVRHARNLQICV